MNPEYKAFGVMVLAVVVGFFAYEFVSGLVSTKVPSVPGS